MGFLRKRKHEPMKNPRSFRTYAASAATLLALTSSLQAQTLYSNSLDSSAGWTVNAGGANDLAVFGFDYSTVGIPASPNGGGSTVGLKLQANMAGGVLSGISVSPTGQAFTGDYQLRFDLWQNYNGPVNGGGSGSTQLSGGGVGTAGTVAQRHNTVVSGQDSLFFMTTGDGGAAQDYRIYPANTLASPTTGYYAAGTTTSPDARNHDQALYSSFGVVSAPAAQTALFPNQTGTSLVGSQAFEWHDVAITKIGNTVTWEIDGILLGTVDVSGIALGGNNILLNHSDINAGSSADANAASMLFGLFDNVRVTVVPEPSTASLLLLAGGMMVARSNRRKH